MSDQKNQYINNVANGLRPQISKNGFEQPFYKHLLLNFAKSFGNFAAVLPALVITYMMVAGTLYLDRPSAQDDVLKYSLLALYPSVFVWLAITSYKFIKFQNNKLDLLTFWFTLFSAIFWTNLAGYIHLTKHIQVDFFWPMLIFVLSVLIFLPMFYLLMNNKRLFILGFIIGTSFLVGNGALSLKSSDFTKQAKLVEVAKNQQKINHANITMKQEIDKFSTPLFGLTSNNTRYLNGTKLVALRATAPTFFVLSYRHANGTLVIENTQNASIRCSGTCTQVTLKSPSGVQVTFPAVDDTFHGVGTKAIGVVKKDGVDVVITLEENNKYDNQQTRIKLSEIADDILQLSKDNLYSMADEVTASK